MPAGLTLDQMMRVPFIVDLISRIHAPGSAISRFYGLNLDSPAAQTIKGRAGQYDIFDYTRSLAPMSSPMAAPTRIARKPIGTQPITLPRTYTAIDILREAVFNTRDLGQQYAPVNANGQAYIARQAQYGKIRHDNNLEFMASRMFAGGWSLVPLAGSSHLNLGELNDATAGAIKNETRVPATHLGNLDGIIDASWAVTTTDILSQLHTLQVTAARENGRRITHVWVNGNTGKHLFLNEKIQSVGGSVYRIFDSLNPAAQPDSPLQKHADTGFVSVVFRGIPDYTFHIYNQGYALPGTSEDFDEQIDANNWKPFIPDNVAIFTPDPGDWCGLVKGSEVVQWNVKESPVEVVGYGMGIEEAIDPPRFDIKMVNNAAPVLTEPRAVYYGTVIF